MTIDFKDMAYRELSFLRTLNSLDKEEQEHLRDIKE